MSFKAENKHFKDTISGDRGKLIDTITWKYKWIQLYKKPCFLFAQYTIEELQDWNGLKCLFTVYGDIIEYQTNFGVKLPTVGNNRTLGSFLGFKRCGEKRKDGAPGAVEILDATYKVDGGKIRYSRREKKRWKAENGVKGGEGENSEKNVTENAEE